MSEDEDVGGRPSLYNQSMIDLICNQIALGSSVRAICAKPNMPSKATVMSWLADKRKKEFLDQYTQARVVQNLLLSDELVELSNPPKGALDSLILINRNRLQIDTRKWLLSKLMPKKYGDNPEVDDATAPVNENTANLTDEELYKFLQLKRKLNGDTN